jgi:hypothetical protein
MAFLAKKKKVTVGLAFYFLANPLVSGFRKEEAGVWRPPSDYVDPAGNDQNRQRKLEAVAQRQRERELAERRRKEKNQCRTN